MTPDPLSSGGADQEKEKLGANEFSWNPFLMHYGAPSEPIVYSYSRSIKREYVRKEKFEHPDASWKKMFLAHPTRLDFRAHVESRFIHGTHNCNYNSSNVDENKVLTMEFLMEIDRKCSERGHRHSGDTIFLRVWPPRNKVICTLPENQLRRDEGS